MKRLIPILFALFVLSPLDAAAQWIKGFNFRDTSGYCTDPANSTYWLVTNGLGGDNYGSTNRNGVEFGTYPAGSVGDNRRDRDAGLDCRLAGATFKANNAAAPNVLRVDLPAAGQYIFCAAIGDAFNTGTNVQVQVCDNASCFSAITAATVTGGHFLDASGVDRANAATWVSSNACVTYTFASTIAYIKYGVGDGSTSGNTFLAHFQFEQVSTDILPLLQATGED